MVKKKWVFHFCSRVLSEMFLTRKLAIVRGKLVLVGRIIRKRLVPRTMLKATTKNLTNCQLAKSLMKSISGSIFDWTLFKCFDKFVPQMFPQSGVRYGCYTIRRKPCAKMDISTQKIVIRLMITARLITDFFFQTCLLNKWNIVLKR